MALPRSFANYTTIDTISKYRRLMIGTEGLTNTGKTEFLMSAPGPNIIIALDRSFDSCVNNPEPPEHRGDDSVFDICKYPTQGQSSQQEYIDYWKDFRNRLYTALNNPDARTVCIDGDSDSWELQLLAEFGKISQIPPMAYQMVDAVRRGLINRCWDSGKIIIGTSKLKDLYEDILDEEGNQIIDEKSKKPKQRKVAGEYKRQGFRDHDYLWQLQIRHLYKGPEAKVVQVGPLKGKVLSTAPAQWGIKIIRCKVKTKLEGDELWGDKANFRGLVEYVYPHIDPREWGFNE